MKTNLKLIAFLAAFAGLAAWAAPSAAAETKDGKATFTELKCNNCHAVSTQGIAVVEEEGAEEDEESEPSDLSGIGAKHDAKWVKDWLNKKVEKDGKTHRKKFAGTPAQLNALADWLAGLKEPAKK